MAAIYSAYYNTQSLINLLQMVYHNVKHYFQMQIDMQEVNEVLAAHFNDFGQKVVEAYIRPLKIKDSVPKYRVPRKYDNALALACEENNLGEKEQLAFLGIYARPEHYELAGNCLIRTKQGELDLNASGRCGLALPSTLIDSITEFEMSAIDCVTFIENKTNYDEYISAEKQSGELVIYHGGFLSPQKRHLFTLIANGAAGISNIRFWADIDKGGFQMFQQLHELIPALVPMRMAGEFVDKFHQHGLARSKEYLSALKTDLENGKHLLFKDAIEKILSFGVTIEQEAFLN